MTLQIVYQVRKIVDNMTFPVFISAFMQSLVPLDCVV